MKPKPNYQYLVTWCKEIYLHDVFFSFLALQRIIILKREAVSSGILITCVKEFEAYTHRACYCPSVAEAVAGSWALSSTMDSVNLMMELLNQWQCFLLGSSNVAVSVFRCTTYLVKTLLPSKLIVNPPLPSRELHITYILWRKGQELCLVYRLK